MGVGWTGKRRLVVVEVGAGAAVVVGRGRQSREVVGAEVRAGCAMMAAGAAIVTGACWQGCGVGTSSSMAAVGLRARRLLASLPAAQPAEEAVVTGVVVAGDVGGRTSAAGGAGEDDGVELGYLVELGRWWGLRARARWERRWCPSCVRLS